VNIFFHYTKQIPQTIRRIKFVNSFFYSANIYNLCYTVKSDVAERTCVTNNNKISIVFSCKLCSLMAGQNSLTSGFFPRREEVVNVLTLSLWKCYILLHVAINVFHSEVRMNEREIRKNDIS
jgi:hypothetical protein